MKKSNNPLNPGDEIIKYIKDNFILCVGCVMEKDYARVYSKQKKEFVGNRHGKGSYYMLTVQNRKQGFRKLLKLHHVVYLLYYGVWPAEQLDHIKSDGWNNHPLNLEPVTDVENQRRKNERLKNVLRNHYEWQRIKADYEFPAEASA